MKRFWSIVITFAVSIGSLSAAYNPPAGGLLIPLLGTPQAAGSGLTVTALDAPWADRLNPAASAAQERTTLDLGFSALTDFGAAAQGFGTAASAGISIPKPYGVWGAGIRFVSTPASMTELPLGTFFTGTGSIAKDLFPNFYVGAGLNFTFGWNNSRTDWGIAADLGFIHLLGDRGFAKDLRWGGVIYNLGKSYCPDLNSYGNLDAASLGAYPPPYTPSLGAEALFVKTDTWKIGMGTTLTFPSFQDFEFGVSGSVSFRNILSFRTAWSIDVRDLTDGNSARSFFPTFALSAIIPIKAAGGDENSVLAKNDWSESEIIPTVALEPLYGSLWSVGAGATVPLGVIDRQAPEIVANFPTSPYGPYYLSPNNDGRSDVLEIPIQIKDKRYIMGYTMTVYQGDPKDGKVVRVIANKESRPETQGVGGLWQRLIYSKKGVPVPDKLVWDGRADSGSVAPDGSYSIEISAVDDNGNKGTVGPFPVVVDSTQPQVELSTPEATRIFSPDGDGNKDTIVLKLSGSQEDKWTLKVLDASGKAVRTVEFAAQAPSDFSWDGKADSADPAKATVVPDGVYSVVIESTDRAGNTVSKRLDNIVVNTQQPPVNIAIDASAFSPNGDGIKDTISLKPSVPVKNGLSSWTLSILDKDKNVVWSRNGTDAAALADASFNGRDNSGKPLPDGQYQAMLEVVYVNGHNPKVYSPSFVIDTVPPSGSVSADRSAFNPAGSAEQNLVTFKQTGSSEEVWTGEICDVAGKVIRTYSFNTSPDAAVEWDGNDDAGKPVPDGTYTYRISSTDRAGNKFVSAVVPVSIDTAKKEVRLTADLRSFSPNGDGQKDTVRFAALVQRPDGVTSYELSIRAAEDIGGLRKDTVIKTWAGKSVPPESIVWTGDNDAKDRAPDGHYVATLTVTYKNADVASVTTPTIMLDTTAPSITVASDLSLFSPNGDGNKDSVHISQSSLPGDDWTGRMMDSTGAVVRSWSWKGKAEDFDWDGTDSAGNPVKDGIYHYEVTSQDAAGNKASATIASIAVDSRVPQVFVTASEAGFSPNGDGFKDSVTFTPIVKMHDGISDWSFVIAAKSGSNSRKSYSGKGDTIPASFVWDGRDDSGTPVQGSYAGTLIVNYGKGDHAEAQSAAVLVNTEGPKAAVKISPDPFSPDNDSVDDELNIALSVRDTSEIDSWSFEVDEVAVVEGAKPGDAPKKRVFIAWSGTGNPASAITWDGRSAKGELVESATDYPYTFKVRDELGNSTTVTGVISVDVLVIRDGDRLKIKVPSIVFRANGADFNTLDDETVQKNMKVIKRIAQILNRFGGYKIGIEGHANSIGKIYDYSQTKIDKEEQDELIPLSLGRAELVKKLLIENGVNAGRLSTSGRGSSEPVVDFKDAENRWKNRRVEFILYKN